jgi:spore germination cell wall hydrolase CwlJ-like protein
MLKITKAATFAAISASIFSLSLGANAGFAFGLETESASLTEDTITIDPMVLAADAAQTDSKLAAAQSEKAPVINNITFTPGIGNGVQPMPPIAQPETPEKATNSKTADVMPTKAKSLAALVAMQDTKTPLDTQGNCLAGAVYFESKGESLAGQLAVAKVVMARAKSGRFASTLCGVVFQKSQFSFVRGGRMPAIDKNSRNWQNAIAISKIALSGSWKSPVEGALFFHARYVSPGWRLARLGAVDNHIFYR